MTVKIINGITFPLQIPLHFSKQVLLWEVYTSFRGGAGGPQQLPGLCLLSRTSLPLGFWHFLAVAPQGTERGCHSEQTTKIFQHQTLPSFFSTTSKAIKALPFTLPFWGHLTAQRKQGASDTFRSVISFSLRKLSIPASEVLTNFVLTEVLLDVGEGFITPGESVTARLERLTENGREAAHRSAFLSLSIFK